MIEVRLDADGPSNACVQSAVRARRDLHRADPKRTADYQILEQKDETKEMNLFKAATTVCCMALMGAALAPGARADDWNKKTVVTLSGPVEIPGVHLTGWGVLPAGTYVFKVLDSQTDRHIEIGRAHV